MAIKKYFFIVKSGSLQGIPLDKRISIVRSDRRRSGVDILNALKYRYYLLLRKFFNPLILVIREELTPFRSASNNEIQSST